MKNPNVKLTLFCNRKSSFGFYSSIFLFLFGCVSCSGGVLSGNSVASVFMESGNYAAGRNKDVRNDGSNDTTNAAASDELQNITESNNIVSSGNRRGHSLSYCLIAFVLTGVGAVMGAWFYIVFLYDAVEYGIGWLMRPRPKKRSPTTTKVDVR